MITKLYFSVVLNYFLVTIQNNSFVSVSINIAFYIMLPPLHLHDNNFLESQINYIK
jgi:hypothetical protein